MFHRACWHDGPESLRHSNRLLARSVENKLFLLSVSPWRFHQPILTSGLMMTNGTFRALSSACCSPAHFPRASKTEQRVFSSTSREGLQHAKDLDTRDPRKLRCRTGDSMLHLSLAFLVSSKKTCATKLPVKCRRVHRAFSHA